MDITDTEKTERSGEKMKIEGKNLKKSFGEHVLFEHFHFCAEANQITAFVGVSGCGKTTLLNMIGMIEDYDEGEILYDGVSIDKKKIRKFRGENISYIFQNYGLIENETVKENLSIVNHSYTKKEFAEKMKQALEIVKLKGFENKKIVECSGGEQQRVAIAKAIIKNSTILLADEPTASLDQENKEIVMHMFKEYANQGRCVILVTHDLSILDLCDKTILIGEKNKKD